MNLWFNPVSGVSGDMLLGALLDLGAPIDDVRAAVAATGLRGWSLESRIVQRSGLRACQAVVAVDEPVAERRARELLDLVGRAPVAVRDVARDTIRRLAEVEARLHATTVDDIHLHEIGGVDTVVDIVGVATALHLLGVTRICSAPLRLGHGTVEAAHGLLPVPAPATLALLVDVPVEGTSAGFETVTPTGAALFAGLGVEYGELPAMTLRATGYGAGGRDQPGRPNVLPALVGDVPVTDGAAVDVVWVVETTVDDVTGEVLAAATDAVRAAGALDVWTASVIGKKGRPAHVVTALCSVRTVDVVAASLARHTGSLGVRRHATRRDASPREFTAVDVAGRTVAVKVGPHRAKPEFDDLLRLALTTGRPVHDLADEAVARWREGRQ